MIDDKLAPEPENKKPSRFEGIGVVVGAGLGFVGSAALFYSVDMGYRGMLYGPILVGTIFGGTFTGLLLGYMIESGYRRK